MLNIQREHCNLYSQESPRVPLTIISFQKQDFFKNFKILTDLTSQPDRVSNSDRKDQTLNTPRTKNKFKNNSNSNRTSSLFKGTKPHKPSFQEEALCWKTENTSPMVNWVKNPEENIKFWCSINKNRIFFSFDLMGWFQLICQCTKFHLEFSLPRAKKDSSFCTKFNGPRLF